jgi:hypothetical protein
MKAFLHNTTKWGIAALLIVALGFTSCDQGSGSNSDPDPNNPIEDPIGETKTVVGTFTNGATKGEFTFDAPVSTASSRAATVSLTGKLKYGTTLVTIAVTYDPGGKTFSFTAVGDDFLILISGTCNTSGIATATGKISTKAPDGSWTEKISVTVTSAAAPALIKDTDTPAAAPANVVGTIPDRFLGEWSITVDAQELTPGQAGTDAFPLFNTRAGETGEDGDDGESASANAPQPTSTISGTGGFVFTNPDKIDQKIDMVMTTDFSEVFAAMDEAGKANYLATLMAVAESMGGLYKDDPLAMDVTFDSDTYVQTVTTKGTIPSTPNLMQDKDGLFSLVFSSAYMGMEVTSGMDLKVVNNQLEVTSGTEKRLLNKVATPGKAGA